MLKRLERLTSEAGETKDTREIKKTREIDFETQERLERLREVSIYLIARIGGGCQIVGAFS